MSTFDIIVLGATGFTGNLIVKCLVKLNIPDLKWAVAGRSKEKLSKLMGYVQGAEMKNVNILVTDVNNSESLINVTRQAKVLLNCVGPNTIYGEQILEACLKTKTQYIDMSAELNHILAIYRKYHKTAEDERVLIIPSCGFASLVAASGLLYLEQEFQGTINTVQCYTRMDIPKRAYFPWPGNCLVHYGTWESMVHVLKNMKEYQRMKKETFPVPLQETPDTKKSFFHRHKGKLWYPYPGPDQDVIEMSERYLAEKTNKRPINMKIYTTMPLFIHFLIIPFLYLYYYLSNFQWFTNLLWRYPRLFTLGYMSHKGPTEEMMSKTKYSFTCIGKGWDESTKDFSSPENKTVTAKVSSSDAYGVTALAMVVAALTVLKDYSKMPPGGVVNVAAAFYGTNLVDRLKNNGIEFEIVPN